MFVQRETTARIGDRSEVFAPKIYYFHPLQAASREAWAHCFERCHQMGFDSVLAAPLFRPGASREIFLTADHERVHPLLGQADADRLAEELVQECKQHGLDLLLDVVVGRVAADADLVRANPNWFHIAASSGERVDPRTPLGQPEAAHIRFDDPIIEQRAADWWVERLLRLARAGVTGFRCIAPQLIPARVWRQLIADIRKEYPACKFLAWTPGLDWRVVAGLQDVGFSAAFSSLHWWDGRASWFVEEYELLRKIGSVIALPEAPFGTRLARRLEGAVSLPATYRHMLRCAATTGSGVLLPMGFEYACSEDMQSRPAANDDFVTQSNGSNIDLAADIREANALIHRLAQLGINGEMRGLDGSDPAVTALLRADSTDVRQSAAPIVILINTDFERERAIPISLHPLPATAGAALSVQHALCADAESSALLRAAEVRVLQAKRNATITPRRGYPSTAKLAKAPRLAVENVVPSVDAGRFAAKRVIGERINVEADAFTDGHGVLVVELLWRAVDDDAWRREQMHAVGNDRWRAPILPDRIGRHEFTIEAWIDKYGTLCRDLEIKASAHIDVDVEIAEARHLLECANRHARGDRREVINSALNWLRDASVESRIAVLLASDLREVMRETEEHDFRLRCEPSLALDIERPQAAFGAWYELFPRSATNSIERHGTLSDVIGKLPMIRDMGFDVLYLPPIHPIGLTNRKGKNNALKAAPGDVGSPYAIGGAEGGHDAIHPALGTIDDFRALRDAASGQGIELALDFAIQCSPDHPWLESHPEWFNWRPDGSIRYAENPPKKYEDIVNVDFYAKGAIPDMWLALRDLVLFWVGEGVRIFRVDNPHTKPLPFWEWMIDEVRARHPDVTFLSEAFTRPKMMYRLAKLGFSQSYTYFTWRNSKQELIDYFTELTTAPVKEFFRPHLFVNTPDINPYFLQTSGRPGFLIRAALAATLSGLWGMYSGFELCESAPLPGREEYLDSEKYEIRVRRHDAPENIVSEITKLNQIRKRNPALQSHLGLRFYPAHSGQVILYGKPLPAQAEMLLVAVSLDPFHVQEVTIEIPLWEWKLPDHASVAVDDLMRDTSFIWNGKFQRVRLEPLGLPFAIWRITPQLGA
jgi:starch synthase (maltosyl-transferring)